MTGLLFVVLVPMVLSLIVGLLNVSDVWEHYKNGSRSEFTMKKMKYGWMIVLSPIACLYVPLTLIACLVYYGVKGWGILIKYILIGLKKLWTNLWILFRALQEKPDNTKLSPQEMRNSPGRYYVVDGIRYNKHGLPINEHGNVLKGHPDYDKYRDPEYRKTQRARMYV